MSTFDPGTTTTNAMPEWYDPFVEPQTIPAGWDLSGLFSDSSTENPDSAD